MVSRTLKGLKIRIKIPLNIFAKTFCEANPMVAAKIPAPAKIPLPISFNSGVKRKIIIMAITIIINVTLFFKNTNFVGSSFKSSERFLIARERIFLKIVDNTKENIIIPITIPQYL